MITYAEGHPDYMTTHDLHHIPVHDEVVIEYRSESKYELAYHDSYDDYSYYAHASTLNQSLYLE